MDWPAMAWTIEPDIAINNDFGTTIRRTAVREASSTSRGKFAAPAPVQQQQPGRHYWLSPLSASGLLSRIIPGRKDGRSVSLPPTEIERAKLESDWGRPPSMLATNDSQWPMGWLLVTSQSPLMFYSYPGALFLTLTPVVQAQDDIWKAASMGNIDVVKQHLVNGIDIRMLKMRSLA